MSTYFARGGPAERLDERVQLEAFEELFRAWGRPLRRVLLLPPDHTRLNSGAGPLTRLLYHRLAPGTQVDILPAIGTHNPMEPADLDLMFGPTIPRDRFLVHDWRHRIRRVGEIPGERLHAWSDGRVDYPVRIEVSEQLFAGYDLILSLGQIVPHEVVGMANYTKNVVVGTGGADTINKSHFLGAVCGMEGIMGRTDSPVRRLFNHAAATFLGELPIVYALTVMQREAATGSMAMRGLFIGDDDATFARGAALARQVNLDLLDRPLRKVLVHLDPAEFKSTWLGNKAVYRTRMAMADGGELIVLAPGLREFGEDREIDRLIRKYGYRGTGTTLASVRTSPELQANLSAAAHLIHGSSEGRFRITYCPGPGMLPDAIRSVGYAAGDLSEMLRRYPLEQLREGRNVRPDGEEIFYISNPALGLWALRSQFAAAD